MNLTRRQFLPFLIIGVGLLGFGSAALRRLRRPVPASLVNPRFRRRQAGTPIRLNLPQGLYLNESSKIVHYINDTGTVTRVRTINAMHLKPAITPVLTADNKAAALPRVALGAASMVFETMARAKLRDGDFQGAAALLEEGIRHDLLRLSRHRRGPTPLDLPPGVRLSSPQETRPSFRIYDLLASESVRAGKDEPVRGMVAQLRSQPPGLSAVFESRLAKWTDTSSAWYKKRRGR